MKRITEMTEEEILAIQMSELPDLIALEALHKGIKLPELVRKEPVQNYPQPDQVMYKIDGVDCHFESMSEAETVMEALKIVKLYVMSINYGPEYSYSRRYVQSKTNPENISISSTQAYSAILYEENRAKFKLFDSEFI